MSCTFRLVDYKKGKPIYTRRESKVMKYHFYRHEHPEFRRHFNRSKRMKMHQYFKRTREVLDIPNTCGWETW